LRILTDSAEHGQKDYLSNSYKLCLANTAGISMLQGPFTQD
jgi:hypothetical protein